LSLKVCYLVPRLLPTPSGAVVGGSAVNCVSLAPERLASERKRLSERVEALRFYTANIARTFRKALVDHA